MSNLFQITNKIFKLNIIKFNYCRFFYTEEHDDDDEREDDTLNAEEHDDEREDDTLNAVEHDDEREEDTSANKLFNFGRKDKFEGLVKKIKDRVKSYNYESNSLWN